MHPAFCHCRANPADIACRRRLCNGGYSLGRQTFSPLSQPQRSVVVAVIPVGMMQVAVHQVIDVITVGYGRMAAARTMNVIFVVALADVMNAPGGIGIRDRYDVLVVVTFMGAMQVPFVQVSHMVPVFYGYVTTVRTVFMGVVLVDGVGHG